MIDVMRVPMHNLLGVMQTFSSVWRQKLGGQTNLDVINHSYCNWRIYFKIQQEQYLWNELEQV